MHVPFLGLAISVVGLWVFGLASQLRAATTAKANSPQHRHEPLPQPLALTSTNHEATVQHAFAASTPPSSGDGRGLFVG